MEGRNSYWPGLLNDGMKIGVLKKANSFRHYLETYEVIMCDSYSIVG